MEFKKITENSINDIKAVTEMFEPYSDFNALSLLCWNEGSENEYCIDGGNLVIKIRNYLKDDFVFSVLGTNKVNQTVERLKNFTTKLNFLPKVTLNALGHKLTISEDRDSFDYVINLQEFTDLRGGKYKNLRKHMSHFEKINPDHKLRALDLDDRQLSDQVLDLVRKWCEIKSFPEDETNTQLDMINRYIKYRKYFNTLDIGLYIKSDLVAVSLNEVLNKDWVMGHFGIADNNYKHCSSFLEFKSASVYLEKGISFLNLQQDTGITGLRETKMSYKPCRFLEKYILDISN